METASRRLLDELFVPADALLYLFTLGCVLLAYLFPLTHFVLNIDGETHDNFGHTISLGRWAHAVLRATILPEPFTPTFTLFVGLAALALAAVLAARQVPLKGVPAYAFCALFVAFPQMAYQFQFLNQADTIGIGYLLAVVSFVLADRSMISQGRTRILGFVGAILSLAVAFGIYQTLVLVPFTLFGGTFVLRHAASPATFRAFVLEAASIGAASVSAVILSTVVGRLAMRAVGRFGDAYLLQDAFAFGDLPGHAATVIANTGRLLGGSGATGFESYVVATAITVLFGFFLLYSHRVRALPLTVALWLTLLAPFGTIVISDHILPARTYVGMNVALAFSVAYLGAMAGAQATAVVGALAFLVSFESISRLYAADHLVREQDIRTAERLSADIEAAFPTGPQTVYFFGGIEPERTELSAFSQTFGGSFLAWDGGQSRRIADFMRFYGIAHLQAASDEEIRLVDPVAATMPVWPDAGSIRTVDGILVVRLSETLGYLPFLAAE